MTKIAIVHDYIKEYGGAERVLETLHEIYPNAPIFTIIYAPHFLGPHKDRFKSWDIRTSFLQYIPFSYKFISIYRLIAPLVFTFFDFSKFDVILVSATGAYSPNGINKKNAKQISYYHTPPRYLYGYATAREINKNIFSRFLLAIVVHILRIVDYKASKNVDVFIANSKNIAERIRKFYRKESLVIYPPVEIPTSFKETKKDPFFLTGGRLARPKHVDIIVQACSVLGVQLKVFGKSFAGYGEQLKAIAGTTVEFLGEISDKEKYTLMKHAKAFVFASEDEDFGIVPVEAMGQGTPVIAYASGGVLETVKDGETGVFFHHLTSDSLQTAIKKFEKTKMSQKACFDRAKQFSKDIFVKSIQKVVNS